MNLRNQRLRRAAVAAGVALVLLMALPTGRGGADAIKTGLVMTSIIGAFVWTLHRAWVSPTFRRVLARTIVALLIGFGCMVFFLTRQQREWQARDNQIRKVMAVNPMPQREATEFTSNLPILIIDAQGQNLWGNSERPMPLRVFEPVNGRASIREKPSFEGAVTLKPRGHSTLRLPKHSYTAHTVDSDGNQVKVPLLGLPKEEDWVLHAPFEDKSLIRDMMALQLARDMGHYAPRTRYLELFLKTSPGPLRMSEYAGVYVLMEKIKRGSDRVNISKLDPSEKTEPGITGGFIIKRDHQDRSEMRIHTRRGGPYFFVYPRPENVSSQQRAWLSSYLNSFEEALYGPDFADPAKGYAAYLDVPAFIDLHWLNELAKNVDGFRYSSYLTKDRDGKIQAGPAWDWNRSFGNANYYDGWQESGWYWPKLRSREISWFRRLREDPAFAKQASERWRELRKDVLDPEKIKAAIDRAASELDEAQARNFKRWPIMGVPVTCNYYVGQSYRDEVSWLKNWIEKRIRWIDKQVEAGADARGSVEDPEPDR